MDPPPYTLLNKSLPPTPQTTTTEGTFQRETETSNSSIHAKPWRDAIVQGIEEELQIVADSGMVSFWETISANVTIYPVNTPT